MTTTNATLLPAKPDLDAILPALRAIAATTPFGFARVAHSVTAIPEVTIELPTPAGSPITVSAHIAYGSDWKVEVTGASFRLGTVDDIRTTAAVLTVAQNLAALLASIAKR